MGKFSAAFSVLWAVIWIQTGFGQSEDYRPQRFNSVFDGTTLRISLRHTGNAESESFHPEGFIIDGVWAGPQICLDTDLRLGDYRFVLTEGNTDRILYRGGFSSLLEEWRSTPEAQNTTKTIRETVRIPTPLKPGRLLLWKWNSPQDTLLDISINPNEVKTGTNSILPAIVRRLFVNGPPQKQIDLAILASGYALNRENKFNLQCEKLIGEMFAVSPFLRNRKYFSVRTVFPVVAPDSVSGHSLLGVSFGILGIERYLYSFRENLIRQYAAQVPYDFLIILVDSEKYGGGGIYNQYATAAANHPYSAFLLIHEFAHSFAGLADEYYQNAQYISGKYSGKIEPWERNLTILTEKTGIKWWKFIDPAATIPTPWRKAEYDSLGALLEYADISDQKSRLYKRRFEILHDSTLQSVTGLFEGAGYSSEGIYRPSLNCLMFSSGSGGFDKVCESAIDRKIRFFTGNCD